jgi:hypothetical protein
VWSKGVVHWPDIEGSNRSLAHNSTIMSGSACQATLTNHALCIYS